MDQKTKELEYLRDAILNAIVDMKYHIKEIEKLCAFASISLIEYEKTWENKK